MSVTASFHGEMDKYIELTFAWNPHQVRDKQH